jgi:hypothetical protein
MLVVPKSAVQGTSKPENSQPTLVERAPPSARVPQLAQAIVPLPRAEPAAAAGEAATAAGEPVPLPQARPKEAPARRQMRR